jgi:hypothetical protein
MSKKPSAPPSRDRLLSLLSLAQQDVQRGIELPKGLLNEIERFDRVRKTRVERGMKELLVPQLVNRYAEAGLPKRRGTAKQSAFDAAGARIGMTESTVERAYGADGKGTSPDYVNEAISILGDYPNALFEAHVIEELRAVRCVDKKRYMHVRKIAGKHGVDVCELDRLTSAENPPA